MGYAAVAVAVVITKFEKGGGAEIRSFQLLKKKSTAGDLVLDTAIRDWVLIPLSVVMVLIGVLRYFVSKLMRSDQVPDPKIVKEGQVKISARNLRAAANFILAKSFRARRYYYSNETLTFAWVNFFFSGFVAAKIPFPLTQRFRAMLQNGIDLSTVDVSYVSSRSWYFLNLFGLRGLFSLILGEDNATDDAQRMMQMGGFGFEPTSLLAPTLITKSKEVGVDIKYKDHAEKSKTSALSTQLLLSSEDFKEADMSPCHDFTGSAWRHGLVTILSAHKLRPYRLTKPIDSKSSWT
ncbi:ER membrane protein complex subunit [Sesamum angolense]|uniref:ER membrane protein complex subunit 3 n=1 Tax=Sesamum angolense TaxID=2727404 RepID=A0AAE1W4T6_9LAMI|nr:ER membrane protein complex subunit [Sesamum angolense]